MPLLTPLLAMMAYVGPSEAFSANDAGHIRLAVIYVLIRTVSTSLFHVINIVGV